MKGGDVSRGTFETSFTYFCLILTFCGATKEEQLLGKNCFKYFKFLAYFRGILLKTPTP
jgi:hypothetical protein